MRLPIYIIYKVGKFECRHRLLNGVEATLHESPDLPPDPAPAHGAPHEVDGAAGAGGEVAARGEQHGGGRAQAHLAHSVPPQPLQLLERPLDGTAYGPVIHATSGRAGVLTLQILFGRSRCDFHEGSL